MEANPTGNLSEDMPLLREAANIVTESESRLEAASRDVVSTRERFTQELKEASVELEAAFKNYPDFPSNLKDAALNNLQAKILEEYAAVMRTHLQAETSESFRKKRAGQVIEEILLAVSNRGINMSDN